MHKNNLQHKDYLYITQRQLSLRNQQHIKFLKIKFQQIIIRENNCYDITSLEVKVVSDMPNFVFGYLRIWRFLSIRFPICIKYNL